MTRGREIASKPGPGPGETASKPGFRGLVRVCSPSAPGAGLRSRWPAPSSSEVPALSCDALRAGVGGIPPGVWRAVERPFEGIHLNAWGQTLDTLCNDLTLAGTLRGIEIGPTLAGSSPHRERRLGRLPRTNPNILCVRVVTAERAATHGRSIQKEEILFFEAPNEAQRRRTWAPE